MFREGQDIAKEFVQLLEDQKTLTVLDQVRLAKQLSLCSEEEKRKIILGKIGCFNNI